jgi:hypothetical protein
MKAKQDKSNEAQPGQLRQADVSGSAYLVAIKSGKEIEQRIIVAKDVFDVEKKVLQTFKRIEWWEIRCNYGLAVF